jgi:CHAT domain-containing protein
MSPRAFRGLLGISQSVTPGQRPLPNAEKELKCIQDLGSSLHMRSLSGELATIENVVEGMGKCSWVHFACHAVQNMYEPMESAFCLHDGHLTLTRVISNSFSHAEFAFLSACQTAAGDDGLPDEAIHLAAGMLAAGYRSVIGTMWSIRDNDVPLIAHEVYARLICGISPDSSRAAHALRHAVKVVREIRGESSFLSWVPFIHIGL